MLIRTVQKNKSIDHYRDEMYKASDKVNQTIAYYDAMRLFDDYLVDISGKWMKHQEGRWIYAKCSECGSVHDTQSNYCPSCGCLMDRWEADECDI